MDPITLLLIGAGAAAATGLSTASIPIIRNIRLRRTQDLLTRPVVGALAEGDPPRSVYDIFKDLGASEFALEVMAHMDFLPNSEDELEMVAHNISDAVSAYGGYKAMIDSLRETMDDLSGDKDGDHRDLLERRLTLSVPRETEALLPAVTGGGDGGQPRLPPAQPPPLPSAGQVKRGPYGFTRERHLHATVDEAMAEFFGPQSSPLAGALDGGPGGLAAIIIGGVVGSLTMEGGFWEGVSRYAHKHRMKLLRGRVAKELSTLSLEVFHAPAPLAGQIEKNLDRFVQQQRWSLERRRRELARFRKRPRARRPRVQLALLDLAEREARDSLRRAERDVKKLIRQITRYRRSGRHDLAGALIYVNRDILLRDIDAFEAQYRAIEQAGEQLRQALLAPSPALPAATGTATAGEPTPEQEGSRDESQNPKQEEPKGSAGGEE